MKRAEFMVVLPSGGAFYAAWPQTASPKCLQMARQMLTATLDYWIDAKNQARRGEAEYQSWFVAAAKEPTP